LSGASDDLIYLTGSTPHHEEMNVFLDGPHIGTFTFYQNDEPKLHALCLYTGTWCFAVCPENEDFGDVLDWKITRGWGNICSYSEDITFEVPDDVVVKFKKGKR